MTYPAQKLHELGSHAAWGGSGARAVLYDVEQVFHAEADAILEARNVGHALQARVLPIFKHHYDSFIPSVPGEEKAGTPATYVLAAGFVGEEPFIIDIDPNGLVGHHEETGFQSIGSGAPLAQQAHALLAHFRMTERDLDYGTVGALRVLDALDASSPSVGGPMDICRLTPEGATHLSPEDVDEVRTQVKRWVELEHEALDGLFG